MDDDQKLTILLYSILFLSVVAVIGVWESLVQPLFGLIVGNISIS